MNKLASTKNELSSYTGRAPALTQGGASAYTRGKPTRFAPKPKPAPWRAVTPMLGLTASRIANTTAARTARVATSSRGRAFLGIKIAAAAITRPSIRYLIMRFTISAKP